MLGRLGMTIDECQAEYSVISQRLFEKGWVGSHLSHVGLAFGGAAYDHKILENEIKRIVREKCGDADAPMVSRTDSRCKV